MSELEKFYIKYLGYTSRKTWKFFPCRRGKGQTWTIREALFRVEDHDCLK